MYAPAASRRASVSGKPPPVATAAPDGLSKDEWESGAKYEKDFWEYWSKNPAATQQRMNTETTFQFQYEIIGPRTLGQTLFEVLDVGAGPMPALGYKITALPGGMMNLIAIDPLADQYKHMLAKRGMSSPVPVIKMMAEDLTKHFQPNHFDLVYSNNALDHAHDPMVALKHMVALVKPNHHVIVATMVNEGAQIGGYGFHNWNFAHVNSRMVLWSNVGGLVVYDIATEFGALVSSVACDNYNQATYNDMQFAGQYPMMTCVITKHA